MERQRDGWKERRMDGEMEGPNDIVNLIQTISQAVTTY